jgi:hypothetical protein
VSRRIPSCMAALRARDRTSGLRRGRAWHRDRRARPDCWRRHKRDCSCACCAGIRRGSWSE